MIFGGLQEDDISTKITAESTKKFFQLGKNEALSWCFLVFSVRILGGEYQLAAKFMSFTLNLKKFP